MMPVVQNCFNFIVAVSQTVGNYAWDVIKAIALIK